MSQGMRSSWLPEGVSEQPAELVPGPFDGFCFAAAELGSVVDALHSMDAATFAATGGDVAARDSISDATGLLKEIGFGYFDMFADGGVGVNGIYGDWVTPYALSCLQVLAPLIEMPELFELVFLDRAWRRPAYGVRISDGQLQVSADVDAVIEYNF